MNSLNYIGSKRTIFDKILATCQANIPDLESQTFMDLFAGTGYVGFNMQPYVRSVAANDLEYYSYVINKALHCCNYSDEIAHIIDTLNGLVGVKGLIYQHFSNHAECERMFFTVENAMKCDAIRQYIQQYSGQSIYYFLLASLLVSMDKVANTSCVYGAYLKAYKASALKPLVIVPIHTKTDVKVDANMVYNDKAEEICKIGADIVYMDPPYNNRQYSANYSPLNYIAHYDSALTLTGKTGLIEGYNRSDFCKKGEVESAFNALINDVKCKYIVLSYNNEGIMDYDALKKIMESRGALKIYKFMYKKFKAQMTVDVANVYEYLWVLEVGKGTESSRVKGTSESETVEIIID
jgi:adenine-specific DNA-methyltransferase